MGLQSLFSICRHTFDILIMDFDKIINRRLSDSLKWNREDEDVLPLWVADMDFPVPEPVLDALQKRISHGIFGYSKTQESTKLAIQAWLSDRHDWLVETDDILVIPGVVQGFNIAAAAFTNPGDSVLFQTPAYHPFFEVALNTHLNQRVHRLSKDENGYYTINTDEFRNAVSPQTRIFILCNPHNPTGRVFSEKELIKMADICLKENIVICSDEIHCDLVFQGAKHIPIASLSGDISQRTITLISASKTFNLAGLKSSAVIISNPALREQFQAKLRGFSGSVNLLGDIAMAAAYSHGQDWLGELLQYLELNRDILVDYVSSELPGIHIDSPQGTFLGWLDCTESGLENPADHFLTKGRVALNSGEWFGDEFRKYARINFGCPREILLSALDRIKKSL